MLLVQQSAFSQAETSEDQGDITEEDFLKVALMDASTEDSIPNAISRERGKEKKVTSLVEGESDRSGK